jgi:hypothetical protein
MPLHQARGRVGRRDQGSPARTPRSDLASRHDRCGVSELAPAARQAPARPPGFCQDRWISGRPWARGAEDPALGLASVLPRSCLSDGHVTCSSAVSRCRSGEGPEPVHVSARVDNGPDSVENRVPLWTSRARDGLLGVGKRRVGGGWFDRRSGPIARTSRLSTTVSTPATSKERRPSTVGSDSSTARRRTTARACPPHPHHDDGDDGTKIRMRYPRIVHPVARSRSRQATRPDPLPLGVNPT